MEKLTMREKEKYEIIRKWDEGKITFKKSQLKLGFSQRHMYRLKKIFKEKDKDGFIHGNRGRQPKNTIDQSLSDNIVLYYQAEYQGFNFSHLKIRLFRDKNIDISYSKIYNLLTTKSGILSPRAKKKTKRNLKKIELMKKKENKNKSEKEIEKTVTHQLAIEDATPRHPRPFYFGQNIEMDASSFKFFGDKKTHLHLSIDAVTDELSRNERFSKNFEDVPVVKEKRIYTTNDTSLEGSII